MTVLAAPVRDLATRPQTTEDVVRYAHDLVGASFQAENTDRQTGRNPHTLTISGVGGCTKAAAYALARTPISNPVLPDEARAAVLGDYIHQTLLPRMQRTAGPGAVVERRVELSAAGLTLRGRLDFAQTIAAGAPINAVWDLKTVREWRLQGVRRLDGAYTAHWLQVMAYARAWYQAGHDVDWVIWLYLDRSTGEVHVEVSRFNVFAVMAVEMRMAELVLWSANPDDAPRQAAVVGGRNPEYALMRGPGMAMTCDRCPWLSACWPGAVPGEVGAQRALAATPDGVEQALALYAAGSRAHNDGKRDMEFAKAVLAGVPHGIYGRFVYSHKGGGGRSWDFDAIKQHFEAMGLDVPMRENAPAIDVKRAAQEA
jgi:hypothetical protein